MRVYNNFPEGEYFRLKAAYEKGLKPKAGEEPTVLWVNNFHQVRQDFWHISQLEPASDTEVKAYFEEVRLEKNLRARAYYQYKKKLLKEKI